MLRQLLVGGTVSVCNIAIHGLVMATVVQPAVIFEVLRRTARRLD